MKKLILISTAVLSLTVVRGQTTQIDTTSKPQFKVQLTCTVKNIQLLSKSSEKIIPVDVDSRWALTVQIDTVQTDKLPFNDMKPFNIGETKTFGIHSPTKLFAESDTNSIIGKSYDIEFTCQLSEKSEYIFSSIKIVKAVNR